MALRVFLLFVVFTLNWIMAFSQSLEKSIDYSLSIPDIITLESSTLHFYVLSETEGLITFRNHGDTLRWLYTTEGMQNRGNTIRADSRFAYIYGSDNRLSVIEPTSILGVYTSTTLPSKPVSAARIRNHVYVATEKGGLGRLSIESPAAFDTIPALVPIVTQDEQILDLRSYGDRLIASTTAPGIIIASYSDLEKKLNVERRVVTSSIIELVQIFDGVIYGSTSDGKLNLVRDNGILAPLCQLPEPITDFKKVSDYMVIRARSGRVWLYSKTDSLSLARIRGEAGNFMTYSKDRLWMSEFQTIQKMSINETDTETQAVSKNEKLPEKLTLKVISDQIVTFPNPMILGIEVEENWPTENLQFYARSGKIKPAIESSGLRWRPSSRDIGRHLITILATSTNGLTDSTTFQVDVRPFNAPPRISPVRPMTVGIGDSFELPINAIDPDGPNPNLLRFIGVDMPAGAKINERSGLFTWTPELEQVGDHFIQIIVSDQFGAAAAIDIKITVKEVMR